MWFFNSFVQIMEIICYQDSNCKLRQLFLSWNCQKTFLYIVIFRNPVMETR